jgi:opacity protein-like surface antigen
MLKKLGLLIVVLALAMSAVAAQASASTTTITPPSPVFTDGRLNAYDAGAPIVIYEPQVTQTTVDANGLPATDSVIGSVQVLSWNGSSDSSSLALDVPVDQINAAIAKHPNKDFVIATQNGVSLGYSQSGYFWVSSAPDFEGKVYTFTWQKNF